MIEESLFKSNFIGRDGFRWWIGQIPPIEAMSEQFEGDGWGNRFKVRILGYHPLDEAELSNQDLPWALVMLGVSDGTGSGNFSTSNKIRPGDVVFGFFLDGDNAQQPVIMGLLGNTDAYNKNGNYKFPFVPFTGYTNNVPKPDRDSSTANEANEAKSTAQQGPVNLPKTQAQKIGRASAGGSSAGMKVSPANTCENTTLTTIENELQNLIKKIQEKQAKISELKQDIDEVAEVIKGAISWLVGEIFKEINAFLVGDYTKNPPRPGIIPNALNALYTSVYTATLPAAGPAAANIAATKALQTMVVPVSTVEAALICVQNALVEGLVGLIKELLFSMLENIERFVTCIVDQFVGSLLNNIVDKIADGLKGVLDGISGLLGGAIDIISVAQNAISFYNSLGDLLDCNQINTKCDGTKEWIVGAGPKDIMDINGSFDNIFEIVNTAGGLINQAIDAGQGIVGTVEGVKSTLPIFNGDSLQENLTGAFNNCLTTYPSSCGSAKINIFGGGGIGGSAIPIFGPTIERVINDTSIGKNVNKTASVIGAIVTNVGSGYRFPPFVEIVDECGIGYGARARCKINDNGEIESIYIVSSGENYPVGDQDIYGVTDVTVVATGIGYENGDTATDNFGNEYSLTIDDGRIISAVPINITEAQDLVTITVDSENGLGAVLKPILGPIPPQKEVIQVIDCVS